MFEDAKCSINSKGMEPTKTVSIKDLVCKSLEDRLDRLHDTISVLESRLEPIILATTDNPEENTVGESYPPLFDYLRAMSVLISRATNRVQSLIERLAL